MEHTVELVRLAKARLADLDHEAERLRDLIAFYEPPAKSHEERQLAPRSPKSVEGVGSTGRRLSEPWTKMLRFIGERNKTNYNAMERFAKEHEISVTRDGLRSQMTTYSKRGLVKSRGRGSWALTDAGRAKVGLTNGSAGVQGEQPAPTSDFESKGDPLTATSPIALLNSNAA